MPWLQRGDEMAIVMELSSTKTMLSIHLSSVKYKVLLKERGKGGTEENRTIGETAAEMHNGLKAQYHNNRHSRQNSGSEGVRRVKSRRDAELERSLHICMHGVL
jgi:hypothetical protein